MTTLTAFHGTDRVFENFSFDSEKRSAGTNGGIWFSSSSIVAESYTNAGGYNEKAYMKALVNGDIFGDSIGNSSIIKCELSFSNPMVFDAKGNDAGDVYGDRTKITIAHLFEQALLNGFDGLIVNNVDDCGSYVKAENRFSTIYGVACISQIK